jgi:hypothetical protein
MNGTGRFHALRPTRAKNKHLDLVPPSEETVVQLVSTYDINTCLPEKQVGPWSTPNKSNQNRNRGSKDNLYARILYLGYGAYAAW